MNNPLELISLFDLPRGHEGTVSSGGLAASDEGSDRELALRLFEIGFVDGERVRVVARGFPGGEPIAVRVGGTIFALRRFEAERVLVAPLRNERTKS
ncbi:FeoA family protein [Accumulibacter sp.]|uniref:FeoA family protein n=1 Tax=Accumulibacter sp. TaxID=2053492 RepID=UPI0028C3ADDF|nr:FeoA family protein [Accumulibacter sp.]